MVMGGLIAGNMDMEAMQMQGQTMQQGMPQGGMQFPPPGQDDQDWGLEEDGDGDGEGAMPFDPADFPMEGEPPGAMDQLALINALLGPGFWIALLVGLGLLVPLMMAYWFAPPLVALSGLSAIAAMKLSFIACLRNMLPFLLYGLLVFLLALLAIVPFGLGLLVLGPTLMASMYVAYRDIFYGVEQTL
jgi:hypothetical protein